MSCAAPLVSQSDMFGLMPERMFFAGANGVAGKDRAAE
jgi:hypothetical protein